MKRPMMKAADRRLVLSSMVLAVLSVCAFLLLVWEPQQRELAEIALGQAEIRTARLEMESFVRRHPEPGRYEQELTARQKRAERLFLTSGGEADDFFQMELPNMAESAGLTVEQLTAVDTPDSADSSKTKIPLKPRLCRLTLRGGYRAVTEFLARLEQGERFVTVKGWQLKRSGEQTQRGELLLELRLEAYELKQSVGG